MGVFHGALGIHYEITWSATDNTGGLREQDSEQRIDIPVTEVQAVITG